MSKLQSVNAQAPYSAPHLIATLLNKLISGHLNSVGSVTLTQNGTSTVLSDGNIKGTSKIFLTPKTAHAATVTGLWYDPTTVPMNGGKITLTHSAVNQADLTFDYVVLT